MDVFISYRRSERARIEKIADALKRIGFSVWFDAHLTPGDTFAAEIHRELAAAHAVVICWTREALASDWVTAEAMKGLARRILVPVLLEPLELTPPFNVLHTLDLTAWNGDENNEQWARLVDRLRQLVGRPVGTLREPTNRPDFEFLPPARFDRMPRPRPGERWTIQTTIRTIQSALFRRRQEFIVAAHEWSATDELFFAVGWPVGLRCWSAKGSEVALGGQQLDREACTAIDIADRLSDTLIVTARRKQVSLTSVLGDRAPLARNRSVAIWRNETGSNYDPKLVRDHTVPGERDVTAVAWQPSSATTDLPNLAFVTDGDLRSFSTEKKRSKKDSKISVLNGSDGSIRWRRTWPGRIRLLWSPDGKYLATPAVSGWSFELYTSEGEFLDFRTNENDGPWVTDVLPGRPRAGFAWHPSGRFFATGISDREIGVFSVDSLQCIDTVRLGDEHRSDGKLLRSIQWSPDGRRVLAATAVGTIGIIDLKTKATVDFYATGALPADVNFSPDGQRVALPGRDGLRICNPSTGEELASIKVDHYATVRWHPDSARIAIVHGEYRSGVLIAGIIH